jgi:biotin synthase
MNHDIRYDWTLEEIETLYNRPLLDLVFDAATVHRQFHDSSDIQKCSLVSIKTGACPEDCSYCSQSSRYNTDLEREPLMEIEEVVNLARKAKAKGASRLCMGAAWRNAKKGKEFDTVLQMVRRVRDEGLETCVTLGMLDGEQAHQLKEAGLVTYNHNLDTSRENYPNIITTRTYEHRLETLRHVRDADLRVCCGGIIGLGESSRDRCSLLQTLASFTPHPESIPVNRLVPIAGTPLGDTPPVDDFDLVRTIATTRLVCPKARVRLSAGRKALSRETQTLCFLAGANSIFFGDSLLTTPNNEPDDDAKLFDSLGLESIHVA